MYLQVPREEVVRYVSYLSNWRCLVLYVYCARYRAFLSTAYVPTFCGSFPVLALPSTNVEVRTTTMMEPQSRKSSGGDDNHSNGGGGGEQTPRRRISFSSSIVGKYNNTANMMSKRTSKKADIITGARASLNTREQIAMVSTIVRRYKIT